MEFTVPEAWAGKTVEAVARGVLGMSGGRFRSLKFREGGILRNGSPVRSNARLLAGDLLTLDGDGEKAPSEAVLPSALPLNVVYEDDWLLVLEKPALLSMHSMEAADTLAGRLRHYLNGAAAHFVNRLDRGTSGLLLAAKSGYIHDRLRRQLHGPELERRYLALAGGTPEPADGTVLLPISREKDAAGRYSVCQQGREAGTGYETVFAGDGLSLLRLTLFTGRTHQIRVHMAAVGCPLAGDRLYGGPEIADLARPALHACRLRFVHPMTGERLAFSSPMPEDMLAAAAFSPR